MKLDRIAPFLGLALAALASSAAGSANGCGIAPYGTGLGGANPGHLYSSSTPAPGSTLVFEMDSFTPDPSFGPGMGVLIVSASPASVPLLGGTLLVDLGSTLLTQQVLYDIYAQTFVSVPANPALAGVTVYSQVGLFFPFSLGWAFSNGLAVALCP